MPSIDERVSYLESRVEEHARGFGKLRDTVLQLGLTMNRRFDAVDSPSCPRVSWRSIRRCRASSSGSSVFRSPSCSLLSAPSLVRSTRGKPMATITVKHADGNTYEMKTERLKVGEHLYDLYPNRT